MNPFNQLGLPNVPRSTQDLSHDHKFTCDMGDLVPIMWEETLPGDYWRGNIDLLIRALPLISPVYHYIEARIHTYNVPFRILYPAFDQLIFPEDPDDPIVAQPTLFNLTGIAYSSVGDYLGLSPAMDAATDGILEVVAYPVIGYARIYDYHYRDQDLQDKVTGTVAAGNVSWANTLSREAPLKIAWEKDPFTIARPWAQKGDVVTLPVLEGGNLDVTLKDLSASNTAGRFFEDDGTTVVTGAVNAGGAGTNTLVIGAGNEPSVYDPNGTLEVKINDAAEDIIAVRTAFAVQRFLELDSRTGTRVAEGTFGHFNVKTKDGRLNEPELIGVQRSAITISEVLSATQTLNSSNQVVNPVGEMAGHGLATSTGGFSYYCTEHGMIMSLLSIRPKTAYSQGIPRKWTRMERLDYAWPLLAHIGEQPILMQELYAEVTDGDELTEVFGYNERYWEYKHVPSRVSGLMRTDFSYWHLSRKFTTKPLLNSDFIECTPSTEIFAVPSEPGFVCHAIFNLKVTRNLPGYSVPKII